MDVKTMLKNAADRYGVDQNLVLAVARQDLSGVESLAIDETSKARGHDYVTIAADSAHRAVIAVTEERDARAVERLAQEIQAHGGDPLAIESVSIDMSPAFIKGVARQFPNAQVTFDKFHVVRPCLPRPRSHATGRAEA